VNLQWRLATVSAQRAGDATLLAKLGYNRAVRTGISAVPPTRWWPSGRLRR
jgi:hypothetical protein